MKNKMVERDERTTFIENFSYTFGYKFIAYALLLDVIYRSIKFNEAAWDLLGIVIVSGFIMTIYQYRQKILVKGWLKTICFISVITAIIAFILAIILKKF
jgi:hypothetical protein